MTHPADVVARALELSTSGNGASQIARMLDVPRRTVVDWIDGRTPTRVRAGMYPPAVDDIPEAYAYLLGLYLGDGCLSPHRRGVYKLRITLDARYPGIVAECMAAVADVMPASAVGRRLTRDNCFEVYSYSKRWPLFFPQHGKGKKHLRPIELEDWQHKLVVRAPHRLLRGLVQSDGCRFINTGRRWSHPRYAFSNRSSDIRGIFCAACNLMGVRWTTAPNTIYVSRRADVARLDEVIGPKA